MCTISPPLCNHTVVPPKPWIAVDTPLPQSRMNIVRKFAWKGRIVEATLSPVEDVYEVKVPRIQILRVKEKDRDREVGVLVRPWVADDIAEGSRGSSVEGGESSVRAG